MTNWPTKKLGEILEQVPKMPGIFTKDYLKEGKYPIVDQGRSFVAGYTDNDLNIYHGGLPVIIFGDHTRAMKFIDFTFAVGADGTKILKPTSNTDPKYFYYFLRSVDIPSRGYARHFSLLKELEIPLPSLAEQKRIVTKLEKLLGKVKEAKRLRAEAQAAVKDLLPAELHKIFEEGKKKSWEEKALGEICELNPKKSEIKDKKDDLLVSFVPMSAVDESLQKIISFQEKHLSDVKNGYTYFQNGDVLFAKITPCMENGKVAIAKDLKNGIGFGTTEFHVLRARELVLPEWIYYIIRQSFFRDAAKQKMTGSAGQKRVPVQFLRSYKIPLPPLAEQKKIVAHLDSLSEKINKLQEYQKSTAADLAALEQSILHKAFSIN